MATRNGDPDNRRDLHPVRELSSAWKQITLNNLFCSVDSLQSACTMWEVFIALAALGAAPQPPPFTCADLQSNDTYHLSFQGSWTYRGLDPQVTLAKRIQPHHA